MEFTITPVRLHPLCKEIHDAHIFRCPEGVELIYEPSDENIVIDGDKNRIFQVISNLIGNAFKFTTTGHISYGYRREGKYVAFHVTDTGMGIAPDKVDRIFERFVKVNNFAQGTGLGLSICKPSSNVWVATYPSLQRWVKAPHLLLFSRWNPPAKQRRKERRGQPGNDSRDTLHRAEGQKCSPRRFPEE